MDEVARLKATIALHEFVFDQLHGPLSIAAFEAKVATLTARIERLEAALKPFADEAVKYEPDEGDSEELIWDISLTLGHLRNARRELENK